MTGETPATANGQARRIIESYDYFDVRGVPQYQVVKFEPKDFRPRQPNDSGGWIWNLDGVERLLYNAPALAQHFGDEFIYYCEGEKDADRLNSNGLTATTHAGGAKAVGTLHPAALEPLEGKRVVILPDNDPPGEAMAAEVSKKLASIAREVRILRLPGLLEKGDVSDFLDAGNSIADLLRLSEEAKPVKEAEKDPKIRWLEKPMSELPDTGPTADWIIEGILAAGHLTQLNAFLKCGKTTLLGLGLYAIQTGKPFLGKPTKETRSIISSEESDLLWRIRRDKVKLDDHHFLISKPFLSKPTIRQWVEYVDHLAVRASYRKARAVVIDTMGHHATWKSENDSADVQEFLTPLNRLTEAGLGVMLVHHMGRSDGRAGRGSTAIGAVADIIIDFRRYSEDDDLDRRRVLNGMGRFEEIPAELVVALSEDGLEYVPQGDKLAVKAMELHEAIMAALTSNLPGMTADEVHDRMESDSRPKVATVRNELRKGAAKGFWIESGGGKPPRDPYRFRLVPM